ncbi:hypothetical protein [Runella sp. SP2]|uniref:hypothetical protein n=1 Tax=Runella sp. SP2 TaxID=2268026 RepID=UPI000F08BDAF|nr:hypothetical protein [Runella sp. SP2]AYQ32952.1 hypothetical protein DTQ70_12670 [Runella sp. SP2]
MKTRILLLTGAAAVYVGYRLFQNYRTKSGTQSLIKQLKKDPAVGEAFAEELSITVAKQAVSNPNWPQTLQPYLEGQQTRLGDFVMQHAQTLADGSYLLVTIADYRETSQASRGAATNDLHNLNFVLKTTDNQHILYSDLHNDLVDKTLRSDFAQTLFKHIQ